MWNFLAIHKGKCARIVTLSAHSKTCFFQESAIESIDLEERTAPNQIPYCNTAETVDLVSEEDSSPDKYSDCVERHFKVAGRVSRIPEHLGQPSSSCDTKNSSPADSNDKSTKQVLEKLCGQVEMLRKSIVLMEERLTLIEDKTKDIVLSKDQ